MKQVLHPTGSNIRRAKTKQGNTYTSREQADEPRLPHERDESADNQTNSNKQSRNKLRLAYEDVSSGKVDSDKGPVLEDLAKKKYPPT